jgi:hypothetical protein
MNHQETQMKNNEVVSWDGKTIQDVALSVGPGQDVKLELGQDGRPDDGQADVVDDEIDLECEDWLGSIEEDTTPPAPARRPAA